MLTEAQVAALNDQACENNFGRQGEWSELNEDGKAWAIELARLAYEQGCREMVYSAMMAGGRLDALVPNVPPGTLHTEAAADEIERLRTEIAGLRAELERINGRRFPVHSGGMTVPWLMLAPHEPQALENHQQSLERLAERGGLGWAEMLCVLEGCGWHKRSASSDELAKPKVLALVAAFDAAMAKLKETTGG